MKTFVAVAIVVFAALFGISQASAEEFVHKLAIQIDENNPATMNRALNNVENVLQFFESKGEKVKVEVVAYSPGLQMFIQTSSPVKDRIAAMSLESPDITFSACGNTYKTLLKKVDHEVPLVSEARIVPAGVVRLMELQDEGYAYVKP